MLRCNLVVLSLVGVFTSVSLLATPPAGDQPTIESIRKALIRLPYYGVFDFLAFQYDQGSVKLSGFTTRPLLRAEAVSAVKRVARVDEVIDDIEELSISPFDERIRWATFNAIYTDSFLSRYVPGGGLVGFDRSFTMLRYPGMQPFGTYPIHIIVKNGRTLLVGAVDFELDRRTAFLRARAVPGAFGVENEIVVLRPGRS